MATELSIQEMKEIELEIMDEIDRVCRENGMTYFLGYGSCLGAVRHGGFIPWDDDIDVLMMREDYERLYELFNTATSNERFKLVSYRDGTSPQVFLKVVDQSTRVEERYSREEYGSGVWVDIFPLDVMNDVVRSKRKSIERNLALRYLSITKPDTGSSNLIKLAKRIVCPFVGILGPHRFAKRADELCSLGVADEEADTVVDFLGGYTIDDEVPLDLFDPIEVPFEDRRYFIPKGYDEYLSIIFGDWRTPPPEEAREHHTLKAYRL